jgi:putative glycosyltransferase (TIGR04372 family)
MIIDRIFHKINSSKSHPYYYLSPHAYAVGDCSEEIYFGVLRARREGKKLVILSTFNLPWLLKYQLTNSALMEIESDNVFKKGGVVSLISKILMTAIYLPLRLIGLALRKWFSIQLSESYHIPRVGACVHRWPDSVASNIDLNSVAKMEWSSLYDEIVDFRVDDRSINKLKGELGIGENSWYVCLHVRESGFRKDGGMRNYRNHNVDNYKMAIDYINSLGGYVVRLGDASMKKLPPNPLLIDYPFTKYKSDFNDVLLIQGCEFYIGCQSGIHDTAKMFGKKILLINIFNPMYGGPLRERDRGIMKHIYSIKLKRYLSVKEVLLGGEDRLNADWIQFGENYKFVENSPEEILDAVKEFIEIVNNSDEYTGSSLQLEAEKLRRLRALEVLLSEKLPTASCEPDYMELHVIIQFCSVLFGSIGLLCQGYLEKNFTVSSLNR